MIPDRGRDYRDAGMLCIAGAGLGTKKSGHPARDAGTGSDFDRVEDDILVCDRKTDPGHSAE
jgi:hypothetical protein